jgi:hypothetical protein
MLKFGLNKMAWSCIFLDIQYKIQISVAQSASLVAAFKDLGP